MKNLICISIAVFISFAAAAERRIAPTVPREQKRAKIIAEYVICKQPQRYIGWPSIALAPNGDLLVVFSGDRDWHVCPWGKTYLVRKPAGQSRFAEPVVISNTPLDDRGCGLVKLNDGTMLLTFLTSLAFDNEKIERYKPYREHCGKLTAEVREKWAGQWMRRSSDNGVTWGDYIKGPEANSPHGPTVLADSSLMYVRPDVCLSADGGGTWQTISKIERDPATWNSRYAFLSEQHAVEVKQDHIIALSRYRGKTDNDVRLRQIDSFDGGKSWSQPTPTQMQGYPPHLLKLRNGWLLAVYGRRIAPMGERGCISTDDGKTWETDNEIVLSNAVPQGSGDLGYPASEQVPDGTIWTVYYQVEKEKDGEYPCLMATHWQLKDEVDTAVKPAVEVDQETKGGSEVKIESGNLVF